MSENPYAPPQLIQGSEAAEHSGQSALFYCLATSVVGGILMGVSLWFLSGLGLLVMAFVTPVLIRRHFIYAYALPRKRIPSFALLPLYVVLFGIGIVTVIGGAVWAIFPTEAAHLLEDWQFEALFAAGASIGFELALATYLRQRRKLPRLLIPGSLAATMTFTCCWLQYLLNMWYFRRTTAPFIGNTVRIVIAVTLWFSLSTFYSTIAADFEIRRRIKRHQVADGLEDK